MKRLYNFLMIAMVAMMGMTFSSCQDQNIAMDLEGTWEGYTHMQSYYSGRYYNSTYSYVDFSTDPFRFTSGKGHWVDYYSGAPWDYIANHIEWRVKDRVIEIYFVEDDYTIYIDNYRLSDSHFTGRVYWNKSTDFTFDLVHTSSPRWDHYHYGYNYYAPGKDGKAPERPQRVLK